MFLHRFFDFCIKKTQKIKILLDSLKITHFWLLLGRFGGHPAGTQPVPSSVQNLHLASMVHFLSPFGATGASGVDFGASGRDLGASGIDSGAF